MRYFLPLILGAAALLTVYLWFENFIILSVRHVKIGRRLRIAQISDLHRKRYAGDNMLIARKVKEEKPDLIFVTGDLVSRTATDFTVDRELLRELCRTAPVYMIFGNHEQSLPEKQQEDFLKMLAETDVRLMRNSSEQTVVNGVTLNICGIEPPYSTYKKGWSYFNLDKVTADDVTAMIGECPRGETLLLAHNPLFGKAYAEWGADHTFCGHVHGGAVRFFGIGLLSPERKLFPKYPKGVYDIDGKKLCVSAGIGKLRAFNPPEIVIYDI